jgi:hypothetical protein
VNDVDEARAWAVRYKQQGWQPLPAREIDGRVRPALKRYTHIRDGGSRSIPDRRWWTSAVQVATGSRWGLVVLDLDGPMAREVWGDLCRFRVCPPTWEVERDSSGGKHLWFRVPPGSAPWPHRTVLWRLDGAGHCGIELLGDRNLIVAPPSVRGDTRYRFLPGRCPDSLPQPAALPGWLADMLRNAAEPEPAPPPRPLPVLPRPSRSGPHLDWRDVVARAEPLALASLLGIRPASDRPNAAGWMACHSAFREDRHPSASLWCRAATVPRYWDANALGPRSVDLFTLSVLMGRYASWCEAVDGIGEIVGVQPPRRAS